MAHSARCWSVYTYRVQQGVHSVWPNVLPVAQDHTRPLQALAVWQETGTFGKNEKKIGCTVLLAVLCWLTRRSKKNRVVWHVCWCEVSIWLCLAAGSTSISMHVVVRVPRSSPRTLVRFYSGEIRQEVLLFTHASRTSEEGCVFRIHVQNGCRNGSGESHDTTQPHAFSKNMYTDSLHNTQFRTWGRRG